MSKGLSGKRTVHEGNAGGKSTLRRFNFYLKFIPERFLNKQRAVDVISIAIVLDHGASALGVYCLR